MKKNEEKEGEREMAANEKGKQVEKKKYNGEIEKSRKRIKGLKKKKGTKNREKKKNKKM